MKYISSEEVINIFNVFNRNDIEYILLRNINNELPGKLIIGKDIDLLVNKNSYNKIDYLLGNNGYKTISHPHKSDIYLYAMDKFIFKYNKKHKIRLDFCFQIVCRSINQGEWIPLHNIIQNAAWENKKMSNFGEFQYWGLSYEDELITLIVRSIFDKREFQAGYIFRIEELFKFVNIELISEKLELVFYKFTPKLLKQLSEKSYNEIFNKYINFRAY